MNSPSRCFTAVDPYADGYQFVGDAFRRMESLFAFSKVAKTAPSTQRGNGETLTDNQKLSLLRMMSLVLAKCCPGPLSGFLTLATVGWCAGNACCWWRGRRSFLRACRGLWEKLGPVFCRYLIGRCRCRFTYIRMTRI